MTSWIKNTVRRVISNSLRRMSQQQVHTCRVKGYEILLDVESEIEKFRANTYATKEPETLEWIERFFHSGDVMYDVGANVGLYSLFAAKRLHGQCIVYAFEPEALNYAKLNKNIYMNGLSGVVLPCCIAVTDRLCFDTFYLNPNSFKEAGGLVAGSALHSFGTAKDYSGASFQAFHKQGTVGVSIDHLWSAWGLEFPNHIKIDIDGLEEKVIAGAKQTLDDRRLKSVLVEISASKGGSDPILQRLTQAGFTQVTDFTAHSREQLIGTPYEDSVNHVFIRGL